MRTILIGVFLIVVGCGDHQDAEKATLVDIDPYAKSFIGHGIKCVIGESYGVSNDSLLLDSNGNIVSVRDGGTLVKSTKFDALNNPIEERFPQEFFYHYKYFYDTIGSYIIKEVQSLVPTDSTGKEWFAKDIYYKFCRLDEDNRIVEGIDGDIAKEITLYTYDGRGRVTQRKVVEFFNEPSAKSFNRGKFLL
jgi:hypothetical protein